MNEKLTYLAPTCETVALVTQGFLALSETLVQSMLLTIDDPFANTPDVIVWQ